MLTQGVVKGAFVMSVKLEMTGIVFFVKCDLLNGNVIKTREMTVLSSVKVIQKLLFPPSYTESKWHFLFSYNVRIMPRINDQTLLITQCVG